MGSIFSTSIQELILNALKSDDIDTFRKIYNENNITPNQLISSSGRTLVHLCSCYGSIKCLPFLISKGNDINITDQQDGSTPLILASKFNEIDIIKILLSNNCDIHLTQENDLNALDMAILRGNYKIAYYLSTSCKFRPIKQLNEYQNLHYNMNFPLFDLDLFYKELKMQKLPENVSNFAVYRNIKKEFEGKVPDPNETWGHFFKRIAKLELYQPPLINENEVTDDIKNSIYMRLQTKLCEMEYGVKSKLFKEFYFNLIISE